MIMPLMALTQIGRITTTASCQAKSKNDYEDVADKITAFEN